MSEFRRRLLSAFSGIVFNEVVLPSTCTQSHTFRYFNWNKKYLYAEVDLSTLTSDEKVRTNFAHLFKLTREVEATNPTAAAWNRTWHTFYFYYRPSDKTLRLQYYYNNGTAYQGICEIRLTNDLIKLEIHKTYIKVNDRIIQHIASDFTNTYYNYTESTFYDEILRYNPFYVVIGDSVGTINATLSMRECTL